jgi:hypothetical protein
MFRLTGCKLSAEQTGFISDRTQEKTFFHGAMGFWIPFSSWGRPRDGICQDPCLMCLTVYLLLVNLKSLNGGSHGSGIVISLFALRIIELPWSVSLYLRFSDIPCDIELLTRGTHVSMAAFVVLEGLVRRNPTRRCKAICVSQHTVHHQMISKRNCMPSKHFA